MRTQLDLTGMFYDVANSDEFVGTKMYDSQKKAVLKQLAHLQMYLVLKLKNDYKFIRICHRVKQLRIASDNNNNSKIKNVWSEMSI